jgi:hypothetical protein
MWRMVNPAWACGRRFNRARAEAREIGRSLAPFLDEIDGKALRHPSLGPWPAPCGKTPKPSRRIDQIVSAPSFAAGRGRPIR